MRELVARGARGRAGAPAVMLRDALPFARDPHAVCLCREDLAHVPARTGHIVSYPSRWYHHWRPSRWLGCDVTSPSSTPPARGAAARKPRERRETATIYHKRTRPGARPVRRRGARVCYAPGPAGLACVRYGGAVRQNATHPRPGRPRVTVVALCRCGVASRRPGPRARPAAVADM